MIYAVAVVVPILLVETCEAKTTCNHSPEKEQSKTSSRISVKRIEDTWKKEPKSQALQLGWKMNIFLFEAVTLYLLMNEQDVSPSQIFSIYHTILEFNIELKTYQFSFRPKTLAVISKKLEATKARLQIDNELFKKQVQYNWFFD